MPAANKISAGRLPSAGCQTRREGEGILSHAFTNGLKVYLSGDTALMGDMKTVINGFYKVKLAVLNIGSGEESAFAVNELIQPNAVILSHANEAATTEGKVNPGTRTRQFIDLVKDRSVHVPLSGKTMEFDENAKCIAGC